MKKTSFTTVLLAGLLALLGHSCTPGENGTVEHPLIDIANTDAIDIARVELTDSATVLYIDAYYEPHNWIRIASDSYLKANGLRYLLIGAEGIEPDSLFWMPDSGKTHFTLRFDPLPKGTPSFSFIEGDGENAWKLCGVDLTGKRKYGRPKYIPEEVFSPEVPDTIPAPMLESGKTTVNISLTGYWPESGITKLTLYANTIFGTQETHEADINTETAEAEVTFQQDGPVHAFILVGNNYCGSAWLAPGETVDLYADMRAARLYFNKGHRNGKTAPEETSMQQIYTTGTFAGLNQQLSMTGKKYYGLNLHTGEFADWHMTSAQYAAYVMDCYKAQADSVAQSGLSRLEKEYWTLSLQQEACYAMAMGNHLREHNYRHVHKQWDYSVPVDSISPMNPKDAQQIATLFDIANPKLLMSGNRMSYVQAIVRPEVDWMDTARLSSSFVKGMRMTSSLLNKAENAQLQPSDMETLKAAGAAPFFTQLLSRKQQDAKEKLSQMASQVTPAPDVPLEQLFKAIVAPHKGKVVLVDFWNTWCGPCRAAISANEPLKQSELKSDNLVWIYIANETSPVANYMKMIPNIQGIHYRLNDAQWHYLVDKEFDIDGIPSYVVVDKKGNYSLRNDLRNHSLLKETLQKALTE